MRLTIHRGFIVAVLLFCCFGANFIMADTNIELHDIKAASLIGGQVQVTLSFTGQPTLPTTFTLDDPSQMVFDFAAVNNALSKQQVLQHATVGMVKKINFIGADNKVRMVLDVARVVPFTIEKAGNDLVITLQHSAQLPKQAKLPKTAKRRENHWANIVDDVEHDFCEEDPSKLVDSSVASQALPTAAREQDYNIKAIDFRRGEEGEGRLIVELSDAAAPIDFKEVDNEMVLEYVGATIPTKLLRRFDVSDFGTPIKRVVVMQQNDRVVLRVQAVGEYEKVAYQLDNQYVIEAKPIAAQDKEAAKAQKFKFTGERISFNFQDIEVRAVLQLLADFTGLNIIASDSVTGNVTLRLDNVPWDQALDFILKSKGLGKRESGNIVLIAPNEEIATREQLELATIKQAETLAPLQSEQLQINYAKAADIEKMLKTEGNSVLSERGVISVDERTNTLLIKDIPDKLAEIAKLVEKLDVPIRQVLIEAQIVQTTDNFTDAFGINLGGASKTRVGKRPIGIGGDLNAARRIADANAINGSYQSNSSGRAPTADITTTTTTGGTTAGTTTATTSSSIPNDNMKFFDFAQSEAHGKIGFAIAKLPGGTLLDLELRASETEAKTKVLARPKLMTLDQQTATIETGTEIPYSTTAQAGATPSVTFKKAVLKLEVTPQITPNNKVLMALTINQDQPGSPVNGQTGIDTTSLKTSILVDNGETVVLGGIFKVTNSKTVNRIPFLCDIPFLGRLFKDKLQKDTRQEILIFVTPKVIKPIALN